MAEQATESKTAKKGASRKKAAAKSDPGGQNIHATARVVSVQDDLVEIEALTDLDGKPYELVKNEVVYICPDQVNDLGEQEKLKAEVLRVRGRTADAQVYEDTGGVAIGDPVEQSGEMLAVELGPGLLGRVYDGLQNPLHDLATPRGKKMP